MTNDEFEQLIKAKPYSFEEFIADMEAQDD
jgi:hypothetical protein